MERRNLLGLLGSGTAAGLAGCMGILEEDVEGEEEENDTKESEERIPTNFDNEEYIHNQNRIPIEDGKRVKGHNLYVVDVRDVTDDMLTVYLQASVNPVADYDINVHCTPVGPEKSGEWEFAGVEAAGASYEEETDTWVGSSGGYNLRYVMDRFEPDNLIASKTFPKNVFGMEYGDDKKPSDPEHPATTTEGSRAHETVREDGDSAIWEFDLEWEPPLYEPFVFTFTWDDDKTHSPRSGEVITQTPQMVRVGTDEYIHHDFGSGYNATATWDNYEMEDAYRTEVDSSGGTITGRMSRLSHYGRFSDVNKELAEKGNRANNTRSYSPHGTEFVPTTPDGYMDTKLQNVWAVSYEFDTETLDEARATAEAHKTGGNDSRDVYDLINADEVLNHDIVQDVARQIGDVCEGYGATDTPSQVRFVADFIQYMNHTWEIGDGPDRNYLAPGTAHPVETLARGYGDCKDFTVLGNALLEQEPFNCTMHAASIPNVSRYNANDNSGHVTSAVHFDDFGIDGIVEDDLYEKPPLSCEPLEIDADDGKYIYIETSAPFELGYIHEDWDYDDPSNDITYYM
ncbi:hypothetical protein [Natranaeroarchaeum aerophilus]|uniref:Transglutaminase domain-containing protein n=1 Tax=Natranaeroarchaeum aerophilus TaxID=2917711 RepID=A0AAE3FTM8_9EURY|nr:hypothetical protein [Natranaeroarchaeum aerophilus]MCL9814399.1 hypothetical protein [Natranaeroarchaeum aerophilus]